MFGIHPLVTLSGTTISIGAGLERIVLANLLILAALLCTISLALFVSTLTDSSLTAAISAMVVFVVLTILNGFSYFDFMKPYTFTSYDFRSPTFSASRSTGSPSATPCWSTVPRSSACCWCRG